MDEQKFREQFPNSELKFHEPLKFYTYTKTGGPCDVLVFPKSAEEIQAIIHYANSIHEPVMVLGNSSNVIIRDGGIPGVVLMLTTMDHMHIKGDRLIAEAGAKIIDASQLAGDAALTGLEFACGIPGSIGGAIYMNAGAYGGEVSQVIESVDVISLGGRICTLQAEQLDLAYRYSNLQITGDIVLRVVFKLAKGDQTAIKAKMAELTEMREAKQPLELPSCGSVFKRPEGYFTGKLIQEAGLQGHTVGGAQVSQKHAGFIVNVGEATATDYVNMITYIQGVIWRENQVKLEPEVRIIGRELNN